VFCALHDQLASLGRHAQLTCCFSVVAELVDNPITAGPADTEVLPQYPWYYRGNGYKFHGITTLLCSKCAGIPQGWGPGLRYYRGYGVEFQWTANWCMNWGFSRLNFHLNCYLFLQNNFSQSTVTANVKFLLAYCKMNNTSYVHHTCKTFCTIYHLTHVHLIMQDATFVKIHWILLLTLALSRTLTATYSFTIFCE